jgi:hypothetical protein
MKQLTKNNWVTAIALVLAFPAAWFILVNVLNEVGISGPYHSSLPVFEQIGVKKSIGWNINLLILFGPIVACFLTALQILKIDRQFTERHFHFHFAIRRCWFPILVGALSMSLLAIISLYLFGENCHCQ